MSLAMDFRVRLYVLNSDSDWLETGTGHIKLIYSNKNYHLILQSEDDGVCLLNSTLLTNPDSYQIHQDTLIQWTDPLTKEDFALSFQEQESCDQFFQQISDIQKRIAADDHDIDQMHAYESNNSDKNANGDDEISILDLQTLTSILPPPEYKNLAEISTIFEKASNTVQGRDALSAYLSQQSPEYIEKLLDLLEICEDLENLQDLYELANIIRCIICLNETELICSLLADDIYLTVMGVLEYDKAFPDQKADYRHHFKNVAKFKQPVPIENEEIVKIIKLTYRLQFLRDVALARMLPDSTYSLLQSMIYFNNQDILTYFCQNSKFMDSLFTILAESQDEEEDDTANNIESIAEKKKMAVLFLLEICTISKTMQKAVRSDLFKKLGDCGLFALFELYLNDPDVEMRSAVTSLLVSLLEFDAAKVRILCLTQFELAHDPIFVDLLIERICQEPDEGLVSLLTEALKILLDTTGVGIEGLQVYQKDSDAEKFLDFFYQNSCSKLFAPLLKLQSHLQTIECDSQVEDKSTATSSELGNSVSQQRQQRTKQILLLDQKTGSVMSQICEILCSIIKQHAMFSKNYLLHHETTFKSISMLLKSNKTFLRLSAVRVFRVCLGTKDEFYRRLLLKNDVFSSLMTVLLEIGEKSNMLNSAILEIFDFIKRMHDGNKQLIVHIVTHFRKHFDKLQYCSVFKDLELKYEQGQEILPSSKSQDGANGGVLGAVVPKDGWAKVDASEDAYFDDSDDDDEVQLDNQNTASTGGLGTSSTSQSTLPVQLTPTSVESDEDDELMTMRKKPKLGHAGPRPKMTIISPLALKVDSSLESKD